MKRSECIARFLKQGKHNARDLTDRYHAGMEVQVNVDPGNWVPVDGVRNTWTTGDYNFYHFRNPKNAKTDPIPNDKHLRFPLESHALDIGMTGWDFGSRCSRWVGFDFDAIVGHAEGVGISDDDLKRIQGVLSSIPWVEIRKSTSGNGLHVYVFFDPDNLPTTANHTEHAALGRAVLAKLAEFTGLHLQADVDVCGQNLWVWSRRATEENQGLTRLKEATEPLRDIPTNWRDYLKKSGTKGPKAQKAEDDPFLAITMAQRQVPLDGTHRALIQWLGEQATWNEDLHCLHAHTVALKEAATTLNYEGIFDTISPGTDLSQPNCFAFPLPDGAWKVYRFGLNVQEAQTWTTTATGYVGCELNVPSDLATLVKAAGGFEVPDGSFAFASVEDGLAFLKKLGCEESPPQWTRDRMVRFKLNNDKRRLDASINFENGDEKHQAEMGKIGWFEAGKPKSWKKVIGVDVSLHRQAGSSQTILHHYDNRIRNVISEGNDEVGWFNFAANGRWIERKKGDVINILDGEGRTRNEIQRFLKEALENPWLQDNEPFSEEYRKGRKWNRAGARLAFEPSEPSVPHPTWDMVIDHCGRGLDKDIAENPWARQNNIRMGGDYLLLWAAILFRHPKHPLPYLFFFSEDQGTGKSTYGASLELLFQNERGCCNGDTALSSNSTHNGELDGAVLCLVEETDLSGRSEVAYNRMKNWVTAPRIPIHAKYETTYMAANYTHWVHSANKRHYCPIFKGDTRIIMIEAQPFEGKELSWDEELRPQLLKEAPGFLRTLFDLRLPEPQGRLWLPIIETDAKQAALKEQNNGQEVAPRVDYNKLAKALCLFLDMQILVLDDTTSMVWCGSTTKLLQALPPGPWPSTVAHFGKALRRAEVSAALAEFGVELTYVPKKGHTEHPQFELTGDFGFLTEEEFIAEEDLLFTLSLIEGEKPNLAKPRESGVKVGSEDANE